MCHGEKFNALKHLVAALLALTGATWLLVLAMKGNEGQPTFLLCRALCLE